MGNVWIALGLTLFAGLATGIGSGLAFYAKRTNYRFLSVATGFSAGVMLYVSFVEIFFKGVDSLTEAYGYPWGDWANAASFFGGILLIGDEGMIMAGTYGESPRIIPESAMRKYERPPRTLERIPQGPDGHEQDWIRACKSGRPAISDFEYSGPLSETVLMGNLAVRFPGRQLLWDGEAMEVTNDADANAYVRREYREGWEL